MCARLALTWAHHDREGVVCTREGQVRACVLIVSCLKAYDEGAVRDFLLGALLSLSLSLSLPLISLASPLALSLMSHGACLPAIMRMTGRARSVAAALV